MKKHLRYSIEMGFGFLAYGLGLVGLNYFYDETGGSTWLILLPIIPVLYIAGVIIRSLTELDEMQKRITIEAMAFSGLATGFTCFSYLFLRDMDAPEFQAEWAFYMMWLFYGVGLLWACKRYL